MNDGGIRDKARNFYGYGHWAASYWFIGPEEGGDHAAERVSAWRQLGARELCDCREFHMLIGRRIPEYQKWYRENPAPAPPLQFTWRKLMLLLKASRREPYDNDSLRKYQLWNWGRGGGDTCVIELSGVPSPDSNKSAQLRDRLFTEREFDELRRRRIDFISRKLDLPEGPARVVVIYGKAQWDHWPHLLRSSQFEILAGFEARIAKRREATIAFAQHPNRVRNDDYWLELGRRLG